MPALVSKHSSEIHWTTFQCHKYQAASVVFALVEQLEHANVLFLPLALPDLVKEMPLNLHVHMITDYDFLKLHVRPPLLTALRLLLRLE